MSGWLAGVGGLASPQGVGVGQDVEGVVEFLADDGVAVDVEPVEERLVHHGADGFVGALVRLLGLGQ